MAKFWLQLILLIVQELIVLSQQSDSGSDKDVFIQELLLPVRGKVPHTIVLEGSGSDIDISSTMNPKETDPYYTTSAKDGNKERRENYISEDKLVVVERTPVAVVIVLIFMTLLLIGAGVTIGALCWRLRREGTSKRVPVRIVHKLEDDEYSVMMDWT